MLKIAFTAPQPADDHWLRITMLLEAGADYVHVRYPEAEPEAYAEVIERIDPELRSRLTLHGAADIAVGAGAGGLHLNRRLLTPPAGWSGRLSRSLHSADEANNGIISDVPELDYVTLSPIFDSISKPGYGPDGAELLHSRRSIPATLRVVALGGITPERLPLIIEAGFDGYAMLGSLGWNLPINEFKKHIQSCYNS